MKAIKFLVSLLVCLTIGHSVLAETIGRAPLVSKSFATNIAKYKAIAGSQMHPNHFVDVEGDWSNAYSSGQGEFDYIVVKANNTDGGRILKMYPPATSLDGIISLPGFVDVLTGESFMPSVQTQDNRNGMNDYDTSMGWLLDNYFHYGSLVIGKDTFHIVIAYMGSLRYPTVSLNWGEGSSILDPGTIMDFLSDPSTEDPFTETETMITVVKDQGFPNETYLLVGSPKEYTHIKIEVSNDLKVWKTVNPELVPYVIYGDVIMYGLPSTEGISFFRAVEL